MPTTPIIRSTRNHVAGGTTPIASRKHVNASTRFDWIVK